MKIQIIGGKVGLRCKGKTLLGAVNKLWRKSFVEKNNDKKFKFSRLLEGDEIEYRLPFKIFSTLNKIIAQFGGIKTRQQFETKLVRTWKY